MIITAYLNMSWSCIVLPGVSLLVDFPAWRAASSTDSRWQCLCRCAQVDVSLIILEGFKKRKTECIWRLLFVGWKRALPIFMWDAFAERLLNNVNDRFQKNIFPVSAFFPHFASTTLLLWVRRSSVELIAQSFLCAVNLCCSVSMNNRLKG